MTAPPSCFAALALPSVPAIEELQGRLPPELRRIHPADMHLTVAYFGRIDPALHEPLLDALGTCSFGGVEVVFDTLLPLPAREHPTALTLTLADGPSREAVVVLMTEQRPRLADVAGVPPEVRGLLPHVTFARPRGRRMDDAKRAAILAWSDAQPALGARVTLGRPILMRSRPPGGPGPHYEVVSPR